MRKKKLFYIFSGASAIASLSILSSCKQNIVHENVRDVFKKHKEDLNLISIKNSTRRNNFDNLNSDINKKKNILQNGQHISLEVTNNEAEFKQPNIIGSQIEEDVITDEESKILEELLKQSEKNKKTEKKHRIISIIAIASSALVAGIATGVGTYFGLKNIKSSENKKKLQLKDRIKQYKNILKEVKPTEPLFNIFDKMFEISFSKELPKSIFNTLKETVLKDLLQDFNNGNENILIEKLKEIEKPTKDVVDNLLRELININTNSQTGIQQLIKKIKT